MDTDNRAADRASRATVSIHAHSLPAAVGPGFGTKANDRPTISNKASAFRAAQPEGLSVRAENVLKQLATEFSGEVPPRGRWIPSTDLLRRVSFSDLETARSCGPQTMDEIVRWAESQGVVIARPFHAGKTLSAMWRDIIARSSTGQCTKAEIAEALERSRRRKNTRIPLALQSILVQVLNAAGK